MHGGHHHLYIGRSHWVGQCTVDVSLEGHFRQKRHESVKRRIVGLCTRDHLQPNNKPAL